jgi:AraC family transcriptional regulator of adaptative response/methylated-DNA-[protein]-cysteine methyltransferase
MLDSENKRKTITAAWKALELKSPLGPMIAVADAESLYGLRFREGQKHTPTMIRFVQQVPIIQARESKIFALLEEELAHYFKGTLQSFKTPIHCLGTSFQHAVWQALQTIPFGMTCSYSALAISIGSPSSVRAVANANGANPLSILMPCHRVLYKNRDLGGYAAGTDRKQWLLDHEKKHQRF